jgi:hypothetical protein
MGRIIVANRHGHQLVTWDGTLTTEEGRIAVQAAERILTEARTRGCAISKKENGRHVLDPGPFNPDTEEYQIITPIVGG